MLKGSLSKKPLTTNWSLPISILEMLPNNAIELGIFLSRALPAPTITLQCICSVACCRTPMIPSTCCDSLVSVQPCLLTTCYMVNSISIEHRWHNRDKKFYYMKIRINTKRWQHTASADSISAAHERDIDSIEYMSPAHKENAFPTELGSPIVHKYPIHFLYQSRKKFSHQPNQGFDHKHPYDTIPTHE